MVKTFFDFSKSLFICTFIGNIPCECCTENHEANVSWETSWSFLQKLSGASFCYEKLGTACGHGSSDARIGFLIELLIDMSVTFV